MSASRLATRLVAATLLLVTPCATAHAATRWAASVVAYSSQYTPTVWSAERILGPPDVWPAHGDVGLAWAPLTADSPHEFIELDFTGAEPINYVSIFETNHPGAIDSVYAWDPTLGDYQLLWSGAAVAAGDTARVWSATFPTTSYAVSRIRIALDPQAVLGWNELDAVAVGQDLIEMAVPNWADSAVASSSYHATGSYSPMAATGPPNVFPLYADLGGAWATLAADAPGEWLQLFYDRPLHVSGLRIFQTFCPGAIDSIYLRNHDDGSLNLVYAAIPYTWPAVSTILAEALTAVPYSVDGVRISLASEIVKSWNEIDAVALDVDSALVPVPPAVTTDTPPPPAPALAFGAPRPSPFTDATSLVFTLPRGGVARLRILDAQGRRVRTLLDGPAPAGRSEIRWRGEADDGRSVPPGLYFARLEARGTVFTRRLVRLR
jgi:hypothetical protein